MWGTGIVIGGPIGLALLLLDWLIPVTFMPFIGFYFGCIDGTPGENRFGPDPKAGTHGQK